MNNQEFKEALEGALKFYPGIEIKSEQKQCLESLVIDRKDVLGVLHYRGNVHTNINIDVHKIVYSLIHRG
jgi:hypothetical protein